MQEEEIIKIINPSKEIFNLIDTYKKTIANILSNSKITLIGSFAVPMCGKEEFDLLIEVENVSKALKIIQTKEPEKFGIGPIINGEGYCRSKKKFGIICELHIVPKGHPKIEKYINMVKTLRTNPDLTAKYENLKILLNGCSKTKYDEEKYKFLKKHFLI